MVKYLKHVHEQNDIEKQTTTKWLTIKYDFKTEQSFYILKRLLVCIGGQVMLDCTL